MLVLRNSAMKLAGAAICTLLLIHTSVTALDPDAPACNRTIVIKDTEAISFQSGCSTTNWLIVHQPIPGHQTTLRATFTSLLLASPNAFIVVSDSASSWIFSQQSLNLLGDYMITVGNLTLTAQIPKTSPSTFTLSVSIQRFGGNLKTDGSIVFPPNSKPWTYTLDTYWTVLVDEAEQAVLVWNTSQTQLSENSELHIYDGHNDYPKYLLANFTQMSPVVQVFSQSNKMLVVAKDFGKASSFQADIHQTHVGTNVISNGSAALFSVSSPINHETRTWIIKENSETVSLAINQAHIPRGTEVYFYKSLFNYEKPFFTLNTSLPSARTLLLQTNDGLRVDFVSQTSIESPKILFSSFYDVSSDCEASYNFTEVDGEPNVFTSPGYPNVYPFGTTCRWTWSTDFKKLIHIHFNEMDLADDHTFTIDAWTKGVHTISLAMQGSSSPADLAFHASLVQFTLNTSSLDHILDVPHRGFMLKPSIFACGDNLTVPAHKFEMPGDVKGSEHFSCLWYIEVPRLPGEINNINLFIRSNDTTADGSELKLYDGNRLHDTSIVLDFINGTASLLTKTNNIVLSYTLDPKAKTTPSYFVQYSTNDCDEAHQCENHKFCMQDEWKCSGIDECGDWSDEKDCASFAECGHDVVNGSLDFSIDGKSAMACSWLFEASQNGSILVTTIQDLELYHPLDSLTFMDHTNTSDAILSINKENQKELEAQVIVTNTSSLWVSFFSFRPKNGSIFTLHILEYPVGGRYSVSGQLDIPESVNGTTFIALQAEDMNHQVLIQNFKWIQESSPLAEINFYDGLSMKSPLAHFQSTDPPFNVFSTTDKMLIVAENLINSSASMSFMSVQSGSNVVTNGKSGSYYVTAPIKNEIRSWLVNVTNARVALTITQANLKPDAKVNFYKGLSHKKPAYFALANRLLSSRTLFMQVDDGLRVDYVSQSADPSKQIIFSSSYDVVPGCEYDYSMKDGQQFVKSPGYPNVYPFGSSCRWTMTADSVKFLHISFIDVDLIETHTLNIEAFGDGKPVSYTLHGNKVPSDFTFQASKVQFVLNTTDLSKFSDNPPKGFVLNTTVHAHGKNFKNSSDTFNIPDSFKVGAEVSDLWSIGGQLEGNKVSNIEVIIKSNDMKAKGDELTLFDGVNMRESAKVLNLNFVNGVAKLTTKYSRLFILYSVKSAEKSTANYTVNYTINECDKQHQCDNGKLCMQDKWKCSGNNDCEDGSNNRDCLNVTAYDKQVVHGNLHFVLPPLDERYAQEDRWQFEAATANNFLVATLPKLELRHPMDSLTFRDGSNTSAPILIINHGSQNLKDRIIVTNTSSLWVTYLSFIPQDGSTWQLNITESSVGGYFYSTSNHINIPKSTSGTIFFALQAKDTNQQVMIKNFSWASSTLPSSEVNFYEGFSMNQEPLARFQSTDKPFDVFTMGDKMLVVADFFQGDTSASMSFDSIISGHHMIDQSDSKAIQLNLTSPGKTVWLIMPPAHKKETDAAIALTIDKIQLASHNSSVTVQLGPQENAQTIFTYPSIVDGPEKIHIPAKKGARVTIHNVLNADDVQTPAYLDAHYETVSTAASAHNLMYGGEEVQVVSPGYPNLYPLNADYKWSVHYPHYRVLLTFADIDLHVGHKLKIVQLNNSHPIRKITFSGNDLPEDIILEGNEVLITLTSTEPGSSRIAGKGFNMTLRAIDCGDMLHSDAATFATPGFPNLNKSMECVWIVSGDDKTNVQFTLTDVDFSLLTIHDGGSIRDQIITNTSSSMVSSYENVLFLFKYEHTNTSTTGLMVKYEIEKCSQFCNNTRCLHPDWRCDGFNHCGDNTDELNCIPGRSPTAPAPAPSNGVSLGWLGGAIAMSLIAGAALAILIPIAYKKIASKKSGEGYQRFESSVNAS